MKSRLVGSTVRDLALASGLASGLIALLLVCTSASMPPVAADQEEGGELWPAWTSTEPVTIVVTGQYQVWDIQEYSMTITFGTNAVDPPPGDTAVITFAPRMDLELPSPWVPTAYKFEIYGTYQNNGKKVSPKKPIGYELRYDESELGGARENSLILHFVQENRWYQWPVDVDSLANEITWETPWMTQFGIGGEGPRHYAYLPLVVDGYRD